MKKKIKSIINLFKIFTTIPCQKTAKSKTLIYVQIVLGINNFGAEADAVNINTCRMKNGKDGIMEIFAQKCQLFIS